MISLLSSYAVFSVPDARFSSKIPVFALVSAILFSLPPVHSCFFSSKSLFYARFRYLSMHRILQLPRLSPPCPFADCWLFSIPGDKEKPAPAKYIIAGQEKIMMKFYTLTLNMALCILPVPISGAWAVSGSKVIASPGFTVTVVQSLSL